MYRHIERIGRVCYKSEDKINVDSYINFINMLKTKQHGAMLEHGTIYLRLNENNEPSYTERKAIALTFEDNKYSKVVVVDDYDDIFITTNYRVLVENYHWVRYLQYFSEIGEYHERRVSVQFTCDRGVSHEFVRNRGQKNNGYDHDTEENLWIVTTDDNSIAQESTRYCNYSKDKFNNEITCILPPWMNIKEDNYKFLYPKLEEFNPIINSENNEINGHTDYPFLFSLLIAEMTYFNLLEGSWQPQQARNVLPIALKTEVIMTCFMSDWEHFLMLRTAPNAHPQARELAIPLQEAFNQLGYKSNDL
jgi:thymidylate synthase (FAD)